MASRSQSKLWTALAGLAVGGVLLWMWSSWDTGTTTLYLAAASFAAAAFWGLQYVFLTARVILDKMSLSQDEEASSEGQEDAGDSEVPDELET